ncbi:sugar porter family MFS transporter [Sciscionella marina]|uniref:sugar porter family MFS transporter n=1 Tax=Sciscionella marina TaxID=508770 RepID=UPI0003A2166F|nr:sugar porter family MFS transporter [Sciscionella marina]
MVAALGGLSGILYGYDTASMSGALPLLSREFGLGPSAQGLVTSMLLFGALPAIVAATVVSRRLDRRTLLLLAAGIFVVGSIGSALSPNPQVLLVFRFVLGFGAGVANQFGLIYVSELAPARLRGMLTGTYQLAVNVGFMVAYLIGAGFTPSGQWEWILGLGAAPAAIFGLGMLVAPKSPRWLVARGRHDTARAVLRRLRATHTEANQEVTDIDASLRQQQAGLRELSRGAYRPAITLALVLTFFQVFTGINSVIYYSPILFQHVTGGIQAGTIANYSVGAGLVLSTAIALPLIDRVGRVRLLQISLTGQILPCVVIAALPQVTWLALAAVFVYTFAFGIGLGPVFWLLCPEILPLRARAIGMGVITFTQYLLNAVSSGVFPDVLALMGTWVFLIFAGLSALAVWIITRYVPETSQRTLEDIETYWRQRATS